MKLDALVREAKKHHRFSLLNDRDNDDDDNDNDDDDNDDDDDDDDDDGHCSVIKLDFNDYILYDTIYNYL